jgi:hypothetical protein
MKNEQILHLVTIMDEENTPYGLAIIPMTEISRIEFMAVNKSLLLYLKTSEYNFRSEQILRDYPKLDSKNRPTGASVNGPYMKATGTKRPEVLQVNDFEEVKEIWSKWNPGADIMVLEKMHVSILEKIERLKEQKLKEEQEALAKKESGLVVAKAPILGPDGNSISSE